jgi:hypothetical protein
MKILDLIDRFCIWFDGYFIWNAVDLPYDLCRFFSNIKRVFQYLPIIWEDWDDMWNPGAWRLLAKKCELFELNLKGDVYRRHDVRMARICKVLFDRLVNDYYTSKAFRDHATKWGKPEICTDKWNIYYQNVMNESDNEKASKEIRDLLDEAVKQSEKARKLALRIVDKYAGLWWQ